jgi:hypothetical protein
MTTAESVREGTEDRPSRRATPGWVVVMLRELSALWRGGRLLILLIPFSMVLSAMSYLLATNEELNLIPPKEMVLLVLQTALAVSILICLIIGANAISAMRENNAGKPPPDTSGKVSGGSIALACNSGYLCSLCGDTGS